MPKKFDPSNYIWICDECGDILDIQQYFDPCCGVWICTKCGHKNTISEDNVLEDIDQTDKSSK